MAPSASDFRLPPYTPHFVAAAPPALCGSALCKRYMLAPPALGPGAAGSIGGAPTDFPERFRVDPWTSVETRVRWLNALVDQGVRRDRDFLGPIALRMRARAAAQTPRAIAQSILDGQNELVAYEQDPEGEEVFQTARWSIVGGVGDCEDKSVTFATLAILAGLDADVVWVSQPRARNNHVPGRVGLGRLDGRAVPWVDAPWDDHGRYPTVRVTVGPRAAGAPDYRPVWAEPTLRFARVGEHPYDALRRLGTQNPDRANL